MKTFKELREALTIQQRMKRSRTAKRTAKKTAIARKRSMKKPPSQEKINKAVSRAVRKRAFALVDRQGIYSTATQGVKASLEKKAHLKVKKIGAKWAKRLKPEVRKAMKAAYKSRMGKGKKPHSVKQDNPSIKA
jgi:hypothetical protein|tara:strand:- start:285 stop:686 length:402 start_codon:yes stop_codon:yes gene_type:complete